jgi:hypothetical protein
VLGAISGKRYHRKSFIAVKIVSDIIALFCYQETYDTELFSYKIEHFFIPNLQLDQVMVMDNATLYKSQKTKGLVNLVG